MILRKVRHSVLHEKHGLLTSEGTTKLLADKNMRLGMAFSCPGMTGRNTYQAGCTCTHGMSPSANIVDTGISTC
jgi:hypothetical protein